MCVSVFLSLCASLYFFTQQVINVWNSLPEHVVEAETLGVFKIKLDMDMLDTF